MIERDQNIYARLSELVTGSLILASIAVILAVCFT